MDIMFEGIKGGIDWMSSHIWAATVSAAILGALLNAFFAKKKDILIKSAERKSQCYGEYLRVFVEFSNHEKMKDPKGASEVDRNYYHCKAVVVLHGSHEVLEKLAICEKQGITSIADANYLSLIKAMKRDVENPKAIRNWFMRKIRAPKLNRNIVDILAGYHTEKSSR
ncbi:hypothetical protein [Bacillus thuringiensis]|uniref:hypothetical protein n=1 Tax=Bacillus thuringiensis TaxID=1428 RepID=UPI001064AEC9|nr:hypothetical protein [Bacillus thuringiensis]TEA83195.1 hypothetical protein PBMB05447_09535 [Bacillus thuringiensis F14-1]